MRRVARPRANVRAAAAAHQQCGAGRCAGSTERAAERRRERLMAIGGMALQPTRRPPLGARWRSWCERLAGSLERRGQCRSHDARWFAHKVRDQEAILLAYGRPDQSGRGCASATGALRGALWRRGRHPGHAQLLIGPPRLRRRYHPSAGLTAFPSGSLVHPCNHHDFARVMLLAITGTSRLLKLLVS